MDRIPPTKSATVAGLAAILFWSSTVGSYRVVSRAFGTVGTAAALFLGAGLLGVAWRFVRPDAREGTPPARAYWTVCGGLFVLYVTSFHLAVGLARGERQVLEVGLLNYLWPSLTLLLSVPFAGKRMRWPLLPGLLLAALGTVLAMGGQPTVTWFGAFFRNARGNLLAYALGLVAALSWGLYNNASHRYGDGGGVPVFMLAAGALLAAGRLFVVEPWCWSGAVGMELAYLILFPTLLAYGFWERGMARGHWVVLAAVAYLTPVASTVFSSFRLGVAPGTRVWSACACVVVAAVLCRLGVVDEGEGAS